jgi:iron complex transport system ATP-binding protein
MAAVAEPDMSALLATAALRVEAGGRLLCSELDWQPARGTFWCVLGKNGAGKSTLLHTLAGLLQPAAGQIFLHGEPLGAIGPALLARRRGLLEQQQFDAFSSSVLETVMSGRYPYQSGAGWESAEDRRLALQALATVGLAQDAAKDVRTLSGGERQRVALATLLAQDPQLLLLDEPTAHQDAAAQIGVMQLLRDRACAPGAAGTAIAACHDLNLAARFATHALILGAGRHWRGTVAEVLTAPILQQAFGCGFQVLDSAHGRLFVPVPA